MRVSILCPVLLLSGALPSPPAEPAWRSLFDGKTFDGWDDPAKRSPAGDAWTIVNGCIMAKPKPHLREDLVSKATFGDFELAFEWRLAPGTNSGVKYLVQAVEFLDLSKVPAGGIDKQVAFEVANNVSDRRNVAPGAAGKDYTIGFEMQLIDDVKHPDARVNRLHASGSMYSLIPPSEMPANPAGEWNQARIVVHAGMVEHWINDVRVLAASLDNPRIPAGLERRWGREHVVYRLLTGRPKQRTPIVITHHGDQAWFRKLRIREIR